MFQDEKGKAESAFLSHPCVFEKGRFVCFIRAKCYAAIFSRIKISPYQQKDSRYYIVLQMAQMPDKIIKMPMKILKAFASRASDNQFRILPAPYA